MAVIKYTSIEQKEVKIPNCFCGAEPELRDERTLENDDHFYIFIKCPYCGADSERREEEYEEEKCDFQSDL